MSRTGLNDDNVIFAANQSEVHRLDIQHKVVYSAMPQLVLAPVDLSRGAHRVLDQATGSGAYSGLGSDDSRLTCEQVSGFATYARELVMRRIRGSAPTSRTAISPWIHHQTRHTTINR